MSDEDRLRWDDKYQAQLESDPAASHRDDRPEWILSRARTIAIQAAVQPGADENRPLRALDVACGLGRLTIALATECGFSVEGVDISPVAIAAATDAAREAHARVTFQATDLDTWRPPADEYDLIVVHRFLDRVHLPLWIPAALRPGGHLLYGTFLVEQGSGSAGVGPQNPAYRLKSGELSQLYASLEVVESLEGEGFAWLHARRRNRKN